MKRNATIECLLALGAAALLVSSCASPNVNPAKARANTGYVDFRDDSSSDLSWDVARFDDRAQAFRSVFSDVKPLPGGVLRLAFAPGRCRLRITFLNRVITEPTEVEVEVQDGRITPVRVTLTATGAALVDRKTLGLGVTGKGRYGLRNVTRSDESATYSISAVADPSMAYQVKEQMPYAQ